MTLLSEALTQLPRPVSRGPHAWRMMTSEECSTRECKEGVRLELPDSGALEVVREGHDRAPLYSMLWFESSRADEDCHYQGSKLDLAIRACWELLRDWDESQETPPSEE